MKNGINQTAMQELIEYIESNEIVYNKDLILKLKELLEKEKEQIKRDWYNGALNGMGLFEINTGNEYYNQTYNQKEEQKQHIIDIMKADEEDGLYNELNK